MTGPRPPLAARPHRSTPVFTAESVPAGLLRDHRVKDGMYGILEVRSGGLDLVFPGPPRRVERCTPDHSGALPGGVLHHVVMDGPVEFLVHFYRVVDGDAASGACRR